MAHDGRHETEDALVAWLDRFAIPDRDDTALARLSLIVLDTIALGIGSFAPGKSPAARAVAAAELAFGNPRVGTGIVWGSGESAPPAIAALANGTGAEEMDFQEVLIHGRNNGHAAVVVVPALLALAATRPGLSGRGLLHALAAALEANLALLKALGRAHRQQGRGMRTTALGAPVAAALAGARMIGLAPRQIRDALCQAAGALPAGLLAAMAPDNGSFTADKDTAVGLSAMHAVLSVGFAAAGIAASGRALTGARGLFATFGHETLEPMALPPAVPNNLYRYELKRYAANFGAQSAIVATARLRARFGADAIDRLVVQVKTSSAASLSTRTIVNPLSARFSVPYATAAAWLHGDTGIAEFEAPAIFDPRIPPLMERVELQADDALESRHLDEGIFPAVVTAVLKDGGTAVESVDGPWTGEPEAAFRAAILAKARALMAANRTAMEVEAIVAAALSLAAAPTLDGLWNALRRRTLNPA